jgi:hypothetical protein
VRCRSRRQTRCRRCSGRNQPTGRMRSRNVPPGQFRNKSSRFAPACAARPRKPTKVTGNETKIGDFPAGETISLGSRVTMKQRLHLAGDRITILLQENLMIPGPTAGLPAGDRTRGDRFTRPGRGPSRAASSPPPWPSAGSATPPVGAAATAAGFSCARR